MESISQAQEFYKLILNTLLSKNIPFMVGGTHAFSAYTEIERPSKDLDLFVDKRNCSKILTLFRKKNFAVELLNPTWLGKIYHDDIIVDIIFAERHGLYVINKAWFEHARKGNILGNNVYLMPLEQIIRTKCYVTFRNKYDGADIAILILQYGKKLDWKWLLKSMSPHWLLLFSQLLQFIFIFPNAKDNIPSWVMEDLFRRTHKLLAQPTNHNEKLTRGPLISYEYDIAIAKWGYKTH